MIKNKLSFLFQICLMAILSSAAFAADTVKLAENGKALASVEIAPGASVETRSVATEMANYLERISGAPFQVTNAPGAGARIVLGRNNEFPALKYGDRLRGNGQEAFLMRTEGDKVLLLGVTDEAVSHAAYTFLQKLGVRWFFPTEAWEVVPQQRTLTVNLDEVQSPDMPLHRDIWYGSFNNYHTSNVLAEDWMSRNRMKQDGPRTSHSWIGLDEKKDFAEHPEWFALVNGKRRNTKPNYGHPEVIKRAVQTALNATKGRNDGSFTVSAPDGLGFCECDLCLEIAGVTRDSVYKHNQAIFGKRPDGTVVCVTSETIFHMANEVARAVAKQSPNVLIGVFAYSGYAHPPSFDLEPNIYVAVTSAYRRTPLSYDEQIRIYGEKTKQMGVYEYYHLAVWHNFNPNQGQKIAQLQDRMKFYRANNVLGVNAEASNNWGAAGLDFYMASQLMWDVDADVDALYADFLDKAFGNARAPMKSYYDRWEAKAELNPANMGAAFNDLITAYRTANDEGAKARIAQLYLYNRFLHLGQQYEAAKADPDKYSEIGEEYANLFWRLKDMHLLHERVTESVRRPLLPAFTVQELESMMAEDAAWVEENRQEFLTYSRNLVPITTGGQAFPGLKNQPVETGEFATLQLIVPAKAGETVELGIKPKGDNSPYRVTYMTPDEFRFNASAGVAEEVAKGEATGNVSVKAAKPGYYRFIVSDVASVTDVSHPHFLAGNEQKMVNATMYFYVPKGTKQFNVAASVVGGPDVTVFDPNGKAVFDIEGYFAGPPKRSDERRLNTVIEVPAGTDGAVWSVTGPGDTKNNSGVRLSGVPEFLSLNPQQLLVAEEYLK